MARRILLCDDESHILRAAEFKLRRAGLDVCCAGDGEEAWQLIQAAPPELLVTDLQMPRLSGLDLCRRIRADERLACLPIILLTAKGFELAESQLQTELGLAAVVCKPFSPRELLGLVQQLLPPAAPPAPGPLPSADCPLGTPT